MYEDNFTQQTYLGELNAIKANNEKALQFLYTRNYGKVRSFVLKNNGTDEHAKDIFQEAFIAMWRNIQLDRFIPKSDASLDAYLVQIAKNKWLDHLRSAGYKKIQSLDDHLAWKDFSAEEKQDTTEDEKNINDIKEKFRQLGENCREVLIRFYYKKESLREIAEAFNWTETTAKNNKYRCLERLRTLVKKSKF